jgi:hypothetical protein
VDLQTKVELLRQRVDTQERRIEKLEDQSPRSTNASDRQPQIGTRPMQVAKLGSRPTSQEDLRNFSPATPRPRKPSTTAPGSGTA